MFVLGFGKFLGKVRAICGVTSDLDATGKTVYCS